MKSEVGNILVLSGILIIILTVHCFSHEQYKFYFYLCQSFDLLYSNICKRGAL